MALAGVCNTVSSDRTMQLSADDMRSQAQELGLHRSKDIDRDAQSVEDRLRLLWYNEHKRRVWANLFISDG